jgi:uncharacterized RDD family membrane protein YckC
MNDDTNEYAGFWIRTVAGLIDTLCLMILIGPLLTLVYGKTYWSSELLVKGPLDILLSYVLPAIVIVVFWVYRSATPGKMAMKLTIIDAKTGSRPSTPQFIGRYFAYYVSIFPAMLGIIWVGIDKRKQGWHDKLAGTVVIRNRAPEPVRFNQETTDE